MCPEAAPGALCSPVWPWPRVPRALWRDCWCVGERSALEEYQATVAAPGPGPGHAHRPREGPVSHAVSPRPVADHSVSVLLSPGPSPTCSGPGLLVLDSVRTGLLSWEYTWSTRMLQFWSISSTDSEILFSLSSTVGPP